MKPRFERIDLCNFDLEKLNAFQDRTIYQTQAWLDFVTHTQKAEPIVAALRDGNDILGYFTGLIVKKCGLKILGSPLPGWTTFYMGFNLHPNATRRTAMKALIDLVFNELKCHHLEIIDRRITLKDCHDIEMDNRIVKGFEVDLSKGEDELFGNMSSACRRCVRKANKNGVIIEEAKDMQFADDYYTQLKEVFAKQSLTPTYGIERVRELVRHLHPTGMLLLLRARAQNGQCIATGIFPAMNDTMYFWGGASWRQHQILRPNEAIIWYAMKYWKRRGIKSFDMMGGGEYKRKYGGLEIAVPWFRLSKNQSISYLRNNVKRFVEYRRRFRGNLNRINI